MYHPYIQKVEVLKLEKRLDEELFYLRDAPLAYSTIPFDFEPVPFLRGSKVPVNPIKVNYSNDKVYSLTDCLLGKIIETKMSIFV